MTSWRVRSHSAQRIGNKRRTTNLPNIFRVSECVCVCSYVCHSYSSILQFVPWQQRYYFCTLSQFLCGLVLFFCVLLLLLLANCISRIFSMLLLLLRWYCWCRCKALYGKGWQRKWKNMVTKYVCLCICGIFLLYISIINECVFCGGT